ncbi:MAG TPA: hypothetical protein VF765_32040 [Polyangiaceae bacterium]
MPSVCERAVLAAGVGAALALAPGNARAQDTVDPSYGRIEGDLTLVVGAGATVVSSGVRGEGELRLRYLESAGIFAAYEDGPLLGSSAEPQRVLATGLEVRPLFLYRWLQGHETQRAWLDLTLDSFGIEIAATWSQPSGTAFASQTGLQAGLGIEVPILPHATGPWIGLHGGMRWSKDALESGATSSPDDRAAFLAITLAWHQLVATHLVDLGDRAPR